MDDITITIIAGSISFVIMTIAIIAILIAFNSKKKLHLKEIKNIETVFQKQLLKSRIEVQEETSSLLAKELHDNVGQLLTGTKILMGLAERQISAQVSMPDTLFQAQQSLEKAIQELRTLSKALDADWISRFNFMDNLQQQAQRINDTGTAHCSLSLQRDAIPLSPEKQIMLFRVVQESIQNALKHSGADEISIQVSGTEHNIEIDVADNGRGYHTEAEQGMGIGNMQHRTELLGGTLSIESTPGNGTTVSIQIPLA